MREPVVFPASDRPLVSVLVIAWRLADELLRCLAAIAASESRHAYEVVVIANGAAPAVRAALDGVRGIRIVELGENVGFGGGMNRGAAVARGRYLALLNDDAEVEPGWLNALVSAAERHGDSVGAIGSVLLNSNGTVQEAGSRVLSGAGTVQQGAGLTPSAAKAAGFLVERDVDYSSAAALLIPRKLFLALDGFDVRFEPAYFEDVDLEWRIRASGLRIILAPDARVRHRSGASTGKAPFFREWASWRAGTRFIERWSGALAMAAPKDAPPAVLGVVALDPSWLRTGRPGASLSKDRREPARVALEISRDYAGWLERELAVARSAENFIELGKMRHEMHEMWLRNQKLRARVADLEEGDFWAKLRRRARTSLGLPRRLAAGVRRRISRRTTS